MITEVATEVCDWCEASLTEEETNAIYYRIAGKDDMCNVLCEECLLVLMAKVVEGQTSRRKEEPCK